MTDESVNAQGGPLKAAQDNMSVVTTCLAKAGFAPNPNHIPGTDPAYEAAGNKCMIRYLAWAGNCAIKELYRGTSGAAGSAVDIYTPDGQPIPPNTRSIETEFFSR
jgi:hypothetical protein